jgi:AcrR family transcriptional regulator
MNSCPGIHFLREQLKPDPSRSSSLTGRKTGRPRSEKTRKAILNAAFALLKKQGVDDVSMQQIAAQAGVSTATLYRWWDNKHAILLEAYLEKSRELLPYGRSGSPLVRLRKFCLRLIDYLKSENGKVFLRLMLAIQDDPVLRMAFYEKVYQPRRGEGRAVIQEAIAAGELPGTVNPDYLINLLIGPLILPALLGQEINSKSVEAIFDFIVNAYSAKNIRTERPPALRLKR